MLLTFKTLQGQTFTLEVDPSISVSLIVPFQKKKKKNDWHFISHQFILKISILRRRYM